MPSPQELSSYFYLSQIALGVLFVLAFLWLGGRRESGFFNRNPDQRSGRKHLRGKPDLLAEARMEQPRSKGAAPLRLTGISIQGPPHEILGIPADADVATIQKAYRERMKIYHPDLVGRPGTREWKDAQRIAEALNRAKETLLKAQSQRPNRSGR